MKKASPEKNRLFENPTSVERRLSLNKTNVNKIYETQY